MKDGKSFEGLPETVKVGYRMYRIETMGEWDARENSCIGRHYPTRGVIELDKHAEIDAAKAANTVLHEVLHAVWNVFNIPNGDKNDESEHLTEECAVYGVSNGLATVMRDNPALFDWIRERLK